MSIILHILGLIGILVRVVILGFALVMPGADLFVGFALSRSRATVEAVIGWWE